MTANPWKITSTQTTKIDRFKITIDEIMLTNEEAKNFSYIQFRDGVCILAITEDQEIILLKQYRHAVQSWEFELPAGMIEDEEEALYAAKRELLEETGYQSLEWESFDYFFPSPGSTTEKIHLFFAKNAFKVRDQALDPTEDISVSLITPEEMSGMITDGRFKHGAGLACWAKYISKYQHSFLL
ncbi:NUDIX hydrolase [Gracilibacillus dipsosauri]|uniref:NUDIX hydrolase n=1 Tax=Gracilibacillus dipsosauri TaxID=178340 RepID=UPI0024091044